MNHDDRITELKEFEKIIEELRTREDSWKDAVKDALKYWRRKAAKLRKQLRDAGISEVTLK